MPTKTDRILGYLPHTFRALPRPTALYSVVDAFGNELLQAENSLAAIMAAHWVDHADRNADLVDDLARIAALYGLVPRLDESVEEFRDHLKRYIRIFLEGPATVQGILRVAAEALGLRIEDDYAAMDAWWTSRGTNALVTVERRGDDAAKMLLGFDAKVAAGEGAKPARITGTIDLSKGANLLGASIFHLAIDGGAMVTIDLTTQLDPAAARLDAIKETINSLIGAAIADHDGRYLTLSSLSVGPASRLEVADGAGDAAPRLLGLLPRIYHGAAAEAAQITSRDLGDGVDLAQSRYLRLLVDGKHLAEVDCAGTNASTSKSVAEIEQAINETFGVTVASHVGHRLKLTSPTTGFGSSIAFQPAAAQDARDLLFDPAAIFSVGHDATSAVAVGINDLAEGADLSARSKVRVRLDNRSPTTVDCAGAQPARTLLSEIVAAFATHFGQGVASHDGRFIRVASPTTGPTSSVAFETLSLDEDATDVIFGIRSRIFQGASATHAHIVGTPDLTRHQDPGEQEVEGVDLGALHVIRVALDGGEFVEVDLGSRAPSLRAVRLTEISAAINGALGPNVASDDGQHLILTSPTAGIASRIAIEPMEIQRHRRFVTRAFTADEATQIAFGFPRAEAQGVAATPARVDGTADLSRSVDLRDARLLRLLLDSRPPVEIDCVGKRPRATLVREIVDAINMAVKERGENNDPKIVAAVSSDGKNLVLTSPSSGARSQIAFETPHAALDVLLAVDPGTFNGRDATRVTFVGTVDLSAGIDLSATSKIKVSVDSEAHEVDCANASDPAHTTLNDIVVAIDLAFGGKQVARNDGTHVVLLSLSSGDNSRVEFLVPSGGDATKQIFGISAPRTYRGTAALPAQAAGTKDLAAPIDVSVNRFLRIAVNGGEPLDLDCAAGATDATTRSPNDIVAAINAAFSTAQAPVIAAQEGSRLVVTTITTGANTRLDLLPHSASDARTKILGNVADLTMGTDPAPAVITGTADLLAPINLLERRFIRLAVDGNASVDVDIAGPAPSTTSLDEIVARINTVFPGMAASTDDDRLRLTSPSRGDQSRLALLPLRALELIEYPEAPAADPPIDRSPRTAFPGDKWTVVNNGAADANLEVELRAPHGVFGPQLVNRTLGLSVRIMDVIRPGEQLKLRRNYERRLNAEIIGTDGSRRLVADSQILVRPIATQISAPSRPFAAESAAVLTVPRGRSEWSYMDCHGSRFNFDSFDIASFAGGRCIERAVFNVSRFLQEPSGPEVSVYSPSPPLSDPPVEIHFRWFSHQPGAFLVNLPADLPERFGGRFNQARFAHAGEKPDEGEQFLGVVTEPPTDADYLKTRVNSDSKLVKAEIVPRVPIGFEAATMPFRKPRTLTGGTAIEPARIYLEEKDVPGFIELSAAKSGSWGNDIRIVARKAGPALFDITISFPGARFENARLLAMGGENMPTLSEDLLKPGPMGVLQAKAAGVRATVARDRTEPIC